MYIVLFTIVTHVLTYMYTYYSPCTIHYCNTCTIHHVLFTIVIQVFTYMYMYYSPCTIRYCKTCTYIHVQCTCTDIHVHVLFTNPVCNVITYVYTYISDDITIPIPWNADLRYNITTALMKLWIRNICGYLIFIVWVFLAFILKMYSYSKN